MGTSIATIQKNGTTGILASQLYKMLYKEPNNFARWATRNIVNNLYIEKNKDWIEIQKTAETSNSSDGRNAKICTFQHNRKKDYILSFPTAKKIILSTKSPRQQELVDMVVKMSEKIKEPMIPISKVDEIVKKMVYDTLAQQSGRLENYDALLLENQKKDEAIKSLQLQTQIKRNREQRQANIRQIVNIVVRETPYYQTLKGNYQTVYNMIMMNFFKIHPVLWRTDWYALKNSEYARAEFARVKVEYGEKPDSKLDWIRITHPEALEEIEETTRDFAVSSLPYQYFKNGGTLPA